MLYRQVIGGLVSVVLSISPAYAQSASIPAELPPKEKCLTIEENLTAHYTIIPDIYNSQGKTVMRYMDKKSSDEKARCGMKYEVDKIVPYGTGIMIYYKKGVRIDGEKDVNR